MFENYFDLVYGVSKIWVRENHILAYFAPCIGKKISTVKNNRAAKYGTFVYKSL